MPIPERFSGFEPLGAATQPHFVQRVIEIIEIIHLFEDFERKDILAMLGRMACYRAPAGSQILIQGEQGDFMVLLLNGEVEIFRENDDGSRQLFGIATAGKTLGEMALIDDEPRSAGCVAQTDITFAVLDREGMSDLLSNEAHVACKILMVLLIMSNARVRSLSSRIAELQGHDA